MQEGECFLSISFEHGFFWQTLWNLPSNKELRTSLQDPGQLLVGDRVMIPERQLKELPAITEVRHKYVKLGATAKLRLVVEYEDMPVCDADYVLTIGALVQKGTTDGQGLLEVAIPPNAPDGLLEIKGLRFALQLGALDPSSEDVGMQRRLANLGFYRGNLDGIIGPQTREAITEFQARAGIPVSGELDAQTRALLLHRHDETHELLPDEATANPGAPSATSQNG